VALGSLPAEGEVQKYLECPAARENSLLAELRREPTGPGCKHGVPGSGAPTRPRSTRLSTTTLMLVRGKALNLSLHLYESAADLDWVLATTRALES